MNSVPTPPATEPVLINATIQRLASQSATCKLYGVVLSVAVLLFSSGRSSAEILLWTLTPAVLLALADAAYVGRVRRMGEAVTGKKPATSSEVIQLQVSSGGLHGLKDSVAGLCSMTVWPFYLILALVVFGLGSTVLAPKAPVMPGPPYYQPQMMPYQVQQGAKAPRPYTGKPISPTQPGSSPVPQGPQSVFQPGHPPSPIRPPQQPINNGQPGPNGSAPVNGQAPAIRNGPVPNPSSPLIAPKPVPSNGGPVVPSPTPAPAPAK